MDRDERPLPSRIEPMMLAHLVTSGDFSQYNQWKERVEAIRQSEAISHTSDPTTRSLLADRGAFRQMRESGTVGTLFGFGLAAAWMAWLIPWYAVDNGFGWLVASSFLLPVPLVWKLGRKLWERASLRGMRDRKRGRAAVFVRAVERSFAAGFGLGFSLVLAQTLLTWFMTPAPTLALELVTDLFHATIGGLLSGGMATVLAPLISRAAPGRAGQSELRALPEEL